MENKIIVSVPDHIYFRRRRVKQALKDVQRIFLDYKVPFEIEEDMGKEFTVSESGECKSKRKASH